MRFRGLEEWKENKVKLTGGGGGGGGGREGGGGEGREGGEGRGPYIILSPRNLSVIILGPDPEPLKEKRGT